MTISDPFLQNFKKRVQDSLSPINFGEPRFSKEIEEIILEKFDGEPKAPESTDLNALCERIKTEREPSVKRRERKFLPWVLFSGAPQKLIEIPVKTSYILGALNNPFKFSYLKGLIHVYLSNYDPNLNGCELIRRFIWDKLSNLTDQKPTPSIKFWQRNKTPIFLPNGHHQTANIFLKNSGKINQILSEYGFRNDLSLSGFVKFVSTSMIDKTKKKFPDNLEKCLSINEIPSHPPGVKFKDLVTKMASEFLPEAEKNIETKEILSTYFLRYLNDPRIPANEIKWRGVEEDSKKIFSQWLSSKDLELFFNIVDKSASDTKWRYRRKFWKAYLPYINNTWVILGNKAKKIAEQVDPVQLQLALNRYGSLEGASSNQSVFLIQMGGYIFVEWNDSGACRVWDHNQCPFKFFQPSYSAYELREEDFEKKFTHHYPERYRWQEMMRAWIRDKTSIFIESENYKL